MIDGLSLVLYSVSVCRVIKTSPLFAEKLSEHVAVKTGEVYYTAEYYGLKIKIYSSGRIEIRGSLHKFFNSWNENLIEKEGHNSNDFSLSNIKSALLYLADSFGQEILQSQIKSIEFGLNITTPIKAADFIKRCIIMLRYGPRLKQPIVRKHKDGFKKGVEYVLDDYTTKLYNKGGQYKIGDNLLRCEFVALRMRAVKDADIKLLADLSDISKLRILHKYLIGAYDDILIRENIDVNELNEIDRRTYAQVDNPDYWDRVDRKVRFIKKGQLARIKSKYATSDHKSEIAGLLGLKFEKLLCA